jgi:nucleotidyltransferase substrate binding protein (TIGR01987 family)
MIPNPDQRWRQRFDNFERSLLTMQELLPLTTLTRTEQTALIKYFEMTFELSWKLLKDYLDELGFSPKSPRESIKLALQAGLITDGQNWLLALEKRNIIAHTYDEATSRAVVTLIQHKFAPLLIILYQHFKALHDTPPTI